MPRRVIHLGVGLIALLAAACTTVEGTPVAMSLPPTSTTAPATTTTTTTTEPPTTTTEPIPKPKGPKQLQVGAGATIPMRPAYQMAYVQVLSIEDGEVAIIAQWAPGTAGDFACYNDCSLSAGDAVTVSGLEPGSTVSLNNLVLVVDKISGAHATVTIGTLH